MAGSYLITGRVVPERKGFSHNGFRLRVKHPEAGLDAWLLVGVTDNQLVAKVVGDIGNQSHMVLKKLARSAEQIVLNAVAFTSGAVFDVDVIGVVNECTDRHDGSFEFHYMDPVHDAIAARRSAFDLEEIWKLCISDDGLPLRMCLSDLHMALRETDDSPFYCYRAIETIKNHIGARFGVGADEDKRQWKVTREQLGLDKHKIMYIKGFADPLRHGRPGPSFRGSEWREMALISWDVVDSYMHFLSQIARGERQWP